jgi:hypothetical protein
MHLGLWILSDLPTTLCRPLSEGALTYARTDVHYSLHIAAVLAKQLWELDRLQQVCAAHLASSAPFTGGFHAYSMHMHGCTHASYALQACIKSLSITLSLYAKPEQHAAIAAAATAVLRRFGGGQDAAQPPTNGDYLVLVTPQQ